MRSLFPPTKEETIFIIVRHGENESNIAKTYDGRTLNLSLTGKGYAQAEAVGKKLSNKITLIDYVITTSMCRTHQTAKEIIKAFSFDQPEFIVDNRFLERNVGKYEGGPMEVLDTIHNEDIRISSSELSFEEKMHFTHEEGIESYATIWKRVHESLQQNSLALKSKVVLVVTHCGTMRSIYWHLTQKLGFFVPRGNFIPDNGACLIVSAKNSDIDLLETDDIKFLA